MSISVTNDFTHFTKYVGREIVKMLSKKYDFDINEAIDYLELNSSKNYRSDDVTEKKEKAKIPLPFCGVINKNCCQAIKLNYGLYTQCNNSPTVYDAEYPVCQTCNKQIEKNTNSEPTYGFITRRLELGVNFRDSKGKAPINYANLMEKMNITRDEAEKAAKSLGLIIPESEFKIKKTTRGRPKKDTTAEDTASESSYTDKPSEKKRGRPKKTKDIVDVNDFGNDILKGLTESLSEDDTTKSFEESDIVQDSESEHEEAIPIKLSKTNKKGYIIVDCEEAAEYLLTSDNELYKPITHDFVGGWNTKTKTIDLVNSDSDS